MNSYDYYVMDVFSNERYRGNPLSVVFTDADLSITAYEKISREFGYSETSFVYYSKPDKALKVRSFTPTGFEVNGAGHNLLGAVYASLLKGMEIFHEQEKDIFVIMKDEKIPLNVDRIGNDPLLIGMRQQPAVIEREVDVQLIAEAISLRESDISIDRLAPVVVKTEVAHLMVPIKNVDALNKARPDKNRLTKIAGTHAFEGVYCFTLAGDDKEFIARARFFNPGMGIDEDPATGSAAGPLAGYLFKAGYVQQDTVYKILQGESTGHPSEIRFKVNPVGIWISGYAVLVMEGTIYE